MKKYLICKDGKQTSIEECFKECRLKDRCAPLSYLKLSAQARDWTGICSVTQLIRGIRESYLMIKNDYAESPESTTYAVSGTKSHSALEKYGIDPEKGIVYEGISGIPDEIDGKTLIDYKFSGSYKVAQVLGVKMLEKETGEFFKNGNPKMKKIPTYGERDFGDWGKQVNMYRIMLKSIGVEIDEQKLFMIPRDGGTYMAVSRGITDSMYYLDVPYIDDEVLKTWFFSRRDQLVNAVNDNELPSLCSDEESWQGKKCVKYCAVREFCTWKSIFTRRSIMEIFDESQEIYCFHTNRGSMISCTVNPSYMIQFVTNYFSRGVTKRVEHILAIDTDGMRHEIATVDAAFEILFDSPGTGRIMFKTNNGTKYYLSKTIMVGA